jgi:hypothetical protein
LTMHRSHTDSIVRRPRPPPVTGTTPRPLTPTRCTDTSAKSPAPDSLKLPPPYLAKLWQLNDQTTRQRPGAAWATPPRHSPLAAPLNGSLKQLAPPAPRQCECRQVTNPFGATECDLLDRSGRRLHLELVGQLADVRRRVAPVATERLQERKLAFLGPAGHGLGRHVQDVSHLGGMEVTRYVGCGLAAGLGCHGASLSCGGPDASRARIRASVGRATTARDRRQPCWRLPC